MNEVNRNQHVNRHDGRRLKLMIGLILAMACAGCTYRHELARVPSPDGRAVAVVKSKERHGLWLPGPEPPETKAKQVRLIVSANGWKQYDSGFEDLSIYKFFHHSCDLDWAPDSGHLAYRLGATLRKIGRDGECRSVNLGPENDYVTSFKWRNDKELLVVAKKISLPIGLFSDPRDYPSYLAKVSDIRILQVGPDSSVTERFKVAVKKPTFMFHSVGFQNQEISPRANRVAFSDGEALCIYDDSLGKIVARVPMSEEIEGTWWDTDNRVIVGLDLFGGKSRRFGVLDIAAQKFEDQTPALLPLWDGMWENPAWHKAGKK